MELLLSLLTNKSPQCASSKTGTNYTGVGPIMATDFSTASASNLKRISNRSIMVDTEMMTVGTGKNIGTQTAKPTLAAIPPLIKCTEVKDDDIIDLNKQCFQ